MHKAVRKAPVEDVSYLQAAPPEVPAFLLRDKNEEEAYWEHYISVKEEHVQKVLQVIVPSQLA